MVMELRWYQQEAVEAAQDALRNKERGVIVLPTGSGKSVVLAELSHWACTFGEHVHVCVLTHTKELVEQNAQTMCRFLPDVGRYCAGLGKKQLHNPVISASIQSISGKSAKIPHRFSLIIVDECHRIPAKEKGLYHKFLEEQDLLCIQERGHGVPVIGLSATPFRLQSGKVYGKDRFFEKLIYEAPIRKLVEEGFLSDLVSFDKQDKPDLTGVKIQNKEYAAAEMEDRFLPLVSTHCRSIVQKAEGRDHWVIFTCGIQHAERVCEELQLLGVHTAVVHSQQPKSERDSAIEWFKNGTLKCLVNCSVLTEGFDAPHIDLVAVLRATKSAGLFVQMAGRGMRIHEGKPNCLLLDYGGNLERHGTIPEIRGHKESTSKGDGTAPGKTCPNCEFFCHAAVLECPECGFQFDPPQRKGATTEAAGKDPLKIPIETLEVKSWDWTYHKKIGSDYPTLRVTYYCKDSGLGGLFSRKVEEFLPFASPKYRAIKVCESWLQKHKRYSQISIANWKDMIKHGLTYGTASVSWHEMYNQQHSPFRPPAFLIVRKNGKYHTIVDKLFETKDEQERARITA